MSEIYRGFDIARKEDRTGVVIIKDGKVLHVADSQEEAMDWVDAYRKGIVSPTEQNHE